MTNAKYIDYPFTAQGVKFISRVYQNAPMAQTIANLPAGVFDNMNTQGVKELIGDVSLLTRAEILSELNRVNEHGSTAFILLDEENN
jgi:hypothetical protein